MGDHTDRCTSLQLRLPLPLRLPTSTTTATTNTTTTTSITITTTTTTTSTTATATTTTTTTTTTATYYYYYYSCTCLHAAYYSCTSLAPSLLLACLPGVYAFTTRGLGSGKTLGCWPEGIPLQARTSSLSLSLSPSLPLPPSPHTHTRRHSMQAARLPVFKPYLDLKVLQSPERPKLLPQKRLTKKSKDIVSFRHPSSKPHPNTRYPDSLAASPALHPETYLEP